MPELSALRRHWLLVSILSARRYGVTVAELSAELGVSTKTIRRDLERLRAQGLPLEEAAGEFGRKTWLLKGSPAAPSFCVEEAAALDLGRRLLDPLAGTSFWTAAQNAFRKIRAMMASPPCATSTSSRTWSTPAPSAPATIRENRT